jgi:hypothetical protein
MNYVRQKRTEYRYKLTKGPTLYNFDVFYFNLVPLLEPYNWDAFIWYFLVDVD